MLAVAATINNPLFIFIGLSLWCGESLWSSPERVLWSQGGLHCQKSAR